VVLHPASLLRHVASSKVSPGTEISAASGAAYCARISGVGGAGLDHAHRTRSAVPTLTTAARILLWRLQGFGHLNLRADDPRCRVVQKVALEVSEFIGPDPLLDVAMALEELVIADEYVVGRCVFPNVNLYLSLVFCMMGFPTDYFFVMVCLPRTAGFLANWREGQTENPGCIASPRQIYTGPSKGSYVNNESRCIRTYMPIHHLTVCILCCSSNVRRCVSYGSSRKARKAAEG
jgi:citrate synthase